MRQVVVLPRVLRLILPLVLSLVLRLALLLALVWVQALLGVLMSVSVRMVSRAPMPGIKMLLGHPGRPRYPQARGIANG